jgi:MFS family permease
VGTNGIERGRVLSVLSVTTLASFLTGLNVRLALVGFPVIAHELGAGFDETLWIIQGFLIGSTIIQLIVGDLADLFGRVRLFNVGLLIFTLGGLASGLGAKPTHADSIANRARSGFCISDDTKHNYTNG